MSRIVRVSVVLAVIGAMFAVTGCDAIIGGAVRSGVEKATGVKVDESGGSVTVTGKDGSTLTSGEELPVGFPAEIPVYAGTIGTAIESKTDKGTSYLLAIKTSDAGKDVVTWYEAQFAEKGWTVKTPMKTDDGGLMNAENDTWKVTMAVGGGADGKSDISMTINPK